MVWFYLLFAILGEVVGTAALKASDGFTRMGFGALSFAGYAVAFYLLSIVLKTVPLGVAYAIWSGVGVAAVTVIGVVGFGQRLDLAGYLGIGLIVTGVIVLNAFSRSIGS